MIAAAIAANRVTSSEAIYTTRQSWLAYTGVDDWYETMLALDLTGNGSFYISNNALQTTPKTAAGTSAQWTFKGDVEYRTATVGGNRVLDALAIDGLSVAGTLTDGTGAAVTGTAIWPGYQIRLAEDYITLDDEVIPFGTVLHTFTAAELASGVNDGTNYDLFDEVINVRYVAASGYDVPASQIVGMSGYKDDFYGIILGGTQAVSNKKRDDLNDAVEATQRTANFKLSQFPLTLDVTDGINNTTWLNNGAQLGTYSRLNYVGSNGNIDNYDVEGSVFTVTYNNTTGVWSVVA
jgi:hypothetical protein